MSLNPVTAAREIFNRYCSYITTTFRLADENLNSQIAEILKKPGSFAKGPIVEILPPYFAGKTIAELIEAKVLRPGFKAIDQDILPADRPLYLHQEKAVETLCQKGQSVVVASGTGSGKTECFMIPILNHLFGENKMGVPNPGVRALLLYPMNALANDQMKKLRELLAEHPQVTFGIYTGETLEKEEEARAKFLRMFGEAPLPNEILSRERMRKAPPHILLTNYAMLEYLLLRPADNVFFQGPFAQSWQFIVLDEAHTYTGAKGIEMAMLLARLKNAIGAKRGRLKFVLTSATLGAGREDAAAVAKFAGRLTGEEFGEAQIITATTERSAQTESWGKPYPELYKKLQGWLAAESPGPADLAAVLQEAAVPKPQIEEFLKSAGRDKPRALFHLLKGDQRLGQIIRLMAGGPVDLRVLAKKVFAGEAEAVHYTASFLDLCNQARLRLEDKALLPARFHFFVKALEGAFITFTPRPKIFLQRLKRVSEDGVDYKAFEIGACTRCHGLYLIGEMRKTVDGYSQLEPAAQSYNMESERNLEFFAVAKEESLDLDNEDDILEGLGLALPSFKHYNLCVYCGGIAPAGADQICLCPTPRLIKLVKVNHKGRTVHKCGLCGSVNSGAGVVRRFYLTEDAISSVLSTALYQQLPGRELTAKPVFQDSVFASDLETAAASANHKVKQLLVFSDSRQNAAFFAPYLSRTYGDFLAGNLLLRTLKEYERECLKNRWTLLDFNRRVIGLIYKLEVLAESRETLQELVWKWLMREFAMRTSRSLENMGLLAFQPDFERAGNWDLLWHFNSLRKVGINPAEAEILYSFLLDQFRQSRAVVFPELVSPHDEFFQPLNQQGGFWRRRPAGLKSHPRGYNLKGWLPAEHSSNTRVDYLSKVLEAGGEDSKKAVGLLEDLWLSLLDNLSPLSRYIETETPSGHGRIYKLDPALFMVVPGGRNSKQAFYRCQKCHRLTKFNLRGVCPAYRCPGRLAPVDLNEELKDDHYRNLHLKMRPEPMAVHEHTAQLATEYAAKVQTDFVEGRINVLSCSTTFELGVDVGELETVFLKNVPPTPANYAQRAGRAGRRIDSTAFALTFARLASHDFNQFNSPDRMIAGVVKPPHFDVNNEKIAHRHLYACAFAHFWRLNPDYFRRVANFFPKEGPKLFKQYLSYRPTNLLAALQEIFPKELQQKLGIPTWSWVDEMYAERGAMTKVVEEITRGLNEIDAAIEDAVKVRNYNFAGWLQRVKKTIETRPLIAFLAQKGLLPKYGFPVDVVNLDVNLHTLEAKNIDLSRDMQIAIAEYAPDSQVVANGKLWTSRYVKRLANRELVQYRYTHCSCGNFRKDLDVEQSVESKCPICGGGQARSDVFVVPEFGFIAESRPKDPGTRRPERTSASRKFFSGAGDLVDYAEISLGGQRTILRAHTHGILTVINNGAGFGFYLCRSCGYGTCLSAPPQRHNDPYGRECRGSFARVSLGYDLETDIAQIDCSNALQGLRYEHGYWESLLFAVIEGMCQELEIDRGDLDGTIYVDQTGKRSLILFDTVPGGAGQAKRILEPGVLKQVLNTSLKLLKRCSCGGEHGDTSCYGCLRNYGNQFLHDRLRRDFGIDALKRILGKRAG